MAYTREKKPGGPIYVCFHKPGGGTDERSTRTRDPRLVALALRRAEERERAAKRGATAGPARTPQEALKDFLDSRERAHRSADTVRFYRERLQPLVSAWKDRPWEEWTAQALEAWLDQRRDEARAAKREPAGAGGDHAMFRACRAWIRWTAGRGEPPPNFLAGFTEPIVETFETEPFSDDQVLALVNAGPTRRERIALGLAGFVGLRHREISRVRWEDVDLEALMVLTHRKTRRALRLDLHPRVAGILASAAAELRIAGKPLTGPVVSTRRLDLKAAYVKVGLPYPRYPLHILRHSLTSNMLADGTPPHDVRDVMGHASLRTTDKYAHTLPEKRRAALLRHTKKVGGPAAPAAGA